MNSSLFTLIAGLKASATPTLPLVSTNFSLARRLPKRPAKKRVLGSTLSGSWQAMILAECRSLTMMASLGGYMLWKFATLWEHPLGKGEATCHSSPWYMVLCTEDVWKATTRVPCSHMTRMVENTLLVAEGICTTIFY